MHPCNNNRSVGKDPVPIVSELRVTRGVSLATSPALIQTTHAADLQKTRVNKGVKDKAPQNNFSPGKQPRSHTQRMNPGQ